VALLVGDFHEGYGLTITTAFYQLIPVEPYFDVDRNPLVQSEGW
jgi:hypothetical protein